MKICNKSGKSVGGGVALQKRSASLSIDLAAKVSKPLLHYCRSSS